MAKANDAGAPVTHLRSGMGGGVHPVCMRKAKLDRVSQEPEKVDCVACSVIRAYERRIDRVLEFTDQFPEALDSIIKALNSMGPLYSAPHLRMRSG